MIIDRKKNFTPSLKISLLYKYKIVSLAKLLFPIPGIPFSEYIKLLLINNIYIFKTLTVTNL